MAWSSSPSSGVGIVGNVVGGGGSGRGAGDEDPWSDAASTAGADLSYTQSSFHPDDEAAIDFGVIPAAPSSTVSSISSSGGGGGGGVSRQQQQKRKQQRKKRVPQQQQPPARSFSAAVASAAKAGKTNPGEEFTSHDYHHHQGPLEEWDQYRTDGDDGAAVQGVDLTLGGGSDEGSCGVVCLTRFLIRVSLLADFVLSSLLLPYGSLLLTRSHDEGQVEDGQQKEAAAPVATGAPPRTAAGLALAIGGLVAVRFLLAISGLSSPCARSCGRFGLQLSAASSPLLSLSLFVLSMICLSPAGRDGMFHYMRDHEDALLFFLSDQQRRETVFDFLHDQSRWIWIALLIWSFLEWPVRYYIFLSHRRYRLDGDYALDGTDSPATGIPSSSSSPIRFSSSFGEDDSTEASRQRNRRRRIVYGWRNAGRPWWWQQQYHHQEQNHRTRNEDLTLALLSDKDNDNDVPRWVSSGAGFEEVPGLSPPSTQHQGIVRGGGPESDWATAAASAPLANSETERRGWWPFRLWSGGSGGNPRDDGSVDFASVQEEWATLSQEDPTWWASTDRGNDNSHDIVWATTSASRAGAAATGNGSDGRRW